jgi:ABC-type lipoprotein export system ATPase subunit
MFIERVQIEEGFLDGADIHFTAGLNVIIGARGTGKTSLIELIRFCLGVENNTTDTNKRSKEHALSVLGSGQITVTLLDEGNRITVTRSASDVSPRYTSPFMRPVIFSQTEIETVGLEAAGRLRLVDGFVTKSPTAETEERDLVSNCRFNNQQIDILRREIDDLEQSLTILPSLIQELNQFQIAEQEVSRTSTTLNAKTDQLNLQSTAISLAGVYIEQTGRLKDEVANWSHDIKRAIDNAAVLPAIIEPEKAASIRPIFLRITEVKKRLEQSLNEAIAIYHLLAENVASSTAEKINLEDISRQLRQEVETIQAGAGSILRKGQELKENIARLQSTEVYINEKKKILDELTAKRSNALDAIDIIRSKRFQARQDAANKLNILVGPNISISIMKNGQYKNFSNAISETLRGSGLRYAEIADALAKNISPRALLEAVDSFDINLIALSTGITTDRASRILSHLKGCDMGELCTTSIEDEVSLHLLDGGYYKDVSELSTGQRCTVVLPLVLAHMNRMLIVDQPEDHIDNAFIADTLIKVILARGGQGQIILSTHNPNIPVLGGAETVVHLGSDGRRGFKLSAGGLHEQPIVNAISTVMEGGAEAFNTRARFYGSHD